MKNHFNKQAAGKPQTPSQLTSAAERCLHPELVARAKAAAKDDGVSLGEWFLASAREATPHFSRLIAPIIARRKTIAASWGKIARGLDRKIVSLADKEAKRAGVSFNEWILRQVEFEQPVPFGWTA
jgi:predicted HicB family RNase H-like nuclease